MSPEQRPEQGSVPGAEIQLLDVSEAALSYARHGWPVFPLQGKIPYKGTHGHHDATIDEEEIRAMWQEHPGANIGLATGSASGVIVLDIDPRHGGHDSFRTLQGAYDQFSPT